MRRGHLIGGLASFVILILIVPSIAALPIERSVVPAEDSTYRVILRMPGVTVAGVTEVISEGVEFIEVFLPPEQYHISERTLSMAVIGEEEVSYLVSVKPGHAGEISGEWHDMLTGKNGTLAGVRISDSGSVEITPISSADPPERDGAPANSAPLGLGILALALCTGGLLFLQRRERK